MVSLPGFCKTRVKTKSAVEIELAAEGALWNAIDGVIELTGMDGVGVGKEPAIDLRAPRQIAATKNNDKERFVHGVMLMIFPFLILNVIY